MTKKPVKQSERAAEQCAETIERRGKGKRYVYSRHRCGNMTRNPSGYCHQHDYYRRTNG